jgi:hypothetical protein
LLKPREEQRIEPGQALLPIQIGNRQLMSQLQHFGVTRAYLRIGEAHGGVGWDAERIAAGVS